MAQRESTQDGQIQFKELGGLNQRPSPSNLPYPEFGLLHGLYPPRDGWMQRLEGIAHVTTASAGVLNLYQADDGTGDLIVQTVDGSELRYTLDEISGRESPTVSLTPDPIEEEDSMSMALIVHEENQGTDGGSLNANAGSEAANTFYRQKLTANPVNEDSIVTVFRDYLAGANPNTWDLAAGTYRVEGAMSFCFDYGYRQSTNGTVTITIASPAVFTINNHGLQANDAFTLSTTGALPTGLSAGTTYYVIAAGLTTNTFRASATIGGAAINTSGVQSGTHTLTSAVKSATGAAAIYDETNSVVLATFTPISKANSYSAIAGNPTFSTAMNLEMEVFGAFTLSGTAMISIQAAVTSSGGINIAANGNCRGESHTATATTLGGSALRNRYTNIRIIKET